MLAAYAASVNPTDPLAGLEVAQRPEPEARAGWSVVTMRAASLNHHDLWSLRGIGLTPERLPMILGCDGAGIDEQGRRVLIYPVITKKPAGDGEGAVEPGRTILSEYYQGTLAERIAAPTDHLIPIPDEWTFSEAACLPTAWLTAYRMLAVRSGLLPGNTVLVQGAGGGVATACIRLGTAMGMRVWATSREAAKRQKALDLGADAVFEPGARLPERVDAVMETVGAATWEHSIKSLRAGGTVVVAGATTGPNPPALLSHIFFRQLNVAGSTMGLPQDLQNLVSLCTVASIRPTIDHEFALEDARAGFDEMLSGELFGKIVITNR